MGGHAATCCRATRRPRRVRRESHEGHVATRRDGAVLAFRVPARRRCRTSIPRRPSSRRCRRVFADRLHGRPDRNGPASRCWRRISTRARAASACTSMSSPWPRRCLGQTVTVDAECTRRRAGAASRSTSSAHDGDRARSAKPSHERMIVPWRRFVARVNEKAKVAASPEFAHSELARRERPMA